MKNRECMPILPGEFRAQTAHLDAEGCGALLLLMMHRWLHGSLPSEPSMLMTIARVDADKWEKVERRIRWPREHVSLTVERLMQICVATPKRATVSRSLRD